MRLAFACRGQIHSLTVWGLPLLGEAKALCRIPSATSPSPQGQTFFTMALTALVGRTTPTQAFHLKALFGYLFPAGRDLLCRNRKNTPLSSACLLWPSSSSAANCKRNDGQASKESIHAKAIILPKFPQSARIFSRKAIERGERERVRHKRRQECRRP